jgi:SepF-like predicted cell division protein (DUF552 family)
MMTEKVEEKELEENESYISDDSLDIEVAVSSDEAVVYVKFSNFEDIEDAQEYAEFLSETLPLLLFETTRIQ